MNAETATFKPVDGATTRRAAAGQKTRLRLAAEAVLRTLAAAALSAALGAVAWQGWQWATHAELFALREVHFTGLQHAEEGDLLRRSGLSKGENIFQADLAQATRGLETHPWIVSARLTRKLPGTVLASVVEHRPAALVQLGNLYVLDEDGRLFKRAAPDDRLDLPLVTGVARDDFEGHKAETQLRLFGALHLLDAWRAAGFSLASLSEVRLDDAGVTLFAHEGDTMQELRMGASEWGMKLKRLVQIRAALARRNEKAKRIDLDNPARPDTAAAQLAQQR